MWQLLFRVLVVRILAALWIVALFPVLLAIMTPFIIGRAAFLASRGRQRLRFAVEDGYTELWDLFCRLIGRSR
ncbi:MAG: hypothetical protein H0X40_16095 [Chthoniobacterales bacterium]|nr:hypothetical protein [Chthoniobacterales bacterium]